MGALHVITWNVGLGSLRILAVSGLFLYVYFYGRKTGQHTSKGWNWLLGGFALLFLSSVLNIIENSTLFTRLAAIGDLGGLTSLVIGFHFWFSSGAKTQETRTQAKLLETQQRYRDLADLSPDGIILHRMGKIIYANAAVANMVGVASPDDMIGKSNLDFVHPDYQVQTYERMRALGSGTKKVPLIYLKILKTSGETLDVEVAAGLTNFGGEKVIHSVVRDISERMKAEKTLRQSESDLRAIFNNMAEFYYRTDLQGRIIRASGAANDIIGYDAADVIGHTLADNYIDPDGHEKFLETLQDAGGHLRNYEAQWAKKNHHHIWVSTNAQHYLDTSGTVVGVEGTVRDITDTIQARDVLQHMAMHDVLTGLGNRRSLEARFKEALPRARRAKTGGAMLYFDLDAFKPVNDTYGHDFGDDVLREVGRRLMDLARETDFVARIGGDEFCLVIEGISDDDAAGQVAQKLIASISAPYHIGDHNITIGVSVGIAAFTGTEDESCVYTLMTAADNAMYAAKTSGGNALRFAPPLFQKPKGKIHG